MVTTRRQSQQRQKQEEQPYPEDRVSEFVEMYPVFCTKNIPSKVVNVE
jgi:hypothetical protein